MNKREQKWTAKFERWFRHFYYLLPVKYQCPAIEIKVETGKSWNFKKLKEHQVNSLLGAKKYGIVYKLSDESRRMQICDVIRIKGAYLVLYFYKRGNKAFYMIDIDKFIEERILSKRKSLTEEDCKRIGKTYKFP